MLLAPLADFSRTEEIHSFPSRPFPRDSTEHAKDKDEICFKPRIKLCLLPDSSHTNSYCTLEYSTAVQCTTLSASNSKIKLCCRLDTVAID